MPALLQRAAVSVDDELDFIRINAGTISARIGYRIGFVIAHNMRLAAKQAARHHRAPPSFTRDIELPNLNDAPPTHRTPRQSKLAPSVSEWSIEVRGPLVALLFDGQGQEFDYETAVNLGHLIRRASRRAKAWAGDHSKYSAMLGYLTDAEADDKLGIA